MLYSTKNKEIIENELERISQKDKETQLFCHYIRNIYYRHNRLGQPDCELWEDFPYDFYRDIESWINKKDMIEIKEYINQLKIYYPHIKESARLFWQHWLAYKNISKRNGKI